jgi:hypothetical protein
LNAAGFSTEFIEYELWDYTPKPMSYYRLKTIDTDESIHISNTISIKRESDHFKLLNISPIPAQNEIWINFHLNIHHSITITLTNLTGQIMTIQQHEKINGINRIRLDLSKFIAAVYFLQIDNGEEQLQQLIVK